MNKTQVDLKALRQRNHTAEKPSRKFLTILHKYLKSSIGNTN